MLEDIDYVCVLFYPDSLKMKKLILLCISGLCCFSVLSGQTKYEREYRISEAEVPRSALDFVQACGFQKKVKWLREENQDHWSIEAKVKHLQTRYSIEFDSLGVLEDVEMIIEWAQVPENIQVAILKQLNELYVRHRFMKIQGQWTGDPDIVQSLIQGKKPSDPYTLKYEIVLKGKREGKVAWYELLFDEKGLLERTSRIVFRNTDNLDF